MSHLGGILTPLSSCFRSAACFDSSLTSPSHCCTCRAWDTESAATMPAMDWDTYSGRQLNKNEEIIFHNNVFKNICNMYCKDQLNLRLYKNGQFFYNIVCIYEVLRRYFKKAKTKGLTLSLTTSGIEGRSSDVTSCLSGKITTFISSSYWSCSTSKPPSIPGWIKNGVVKRDT